jgi:quercetin dioxygenase-like cupin family protein
MEWVQPDAGAITEHDSHGIFMTELARFAMAGEYRTYVTEIEPGGVLGRHVARVGLWQTFYVLRGRGWVSGSDGVRHDIVANQAVLWSQGESHESGSDTGMTAIVVIADQRPPSDLFRVTVRSVEERRSVWSESKMTRLVQDGELTWARALILDVDSGGEGEVVRKLLEGAGLAVELYGIGQPQHLANALAGRGIGGEPQYVILACHGASGNVLLGELAPELAARQPFEHLSPSDVRDHFRLSGAVVMCTGCGTGNSDMAEAFLAGGATGYIAPGSTPEGDAALLLLQLLFYGLTRGRSLASSLERAKEFDPELRQWTLWS